MWRKKKKKKGSQLLCLLLLMLQTPGTHISKPSQEWSLHTQLLTVCVLLFSRLLALPGRTGETSVAVFLCIRS